MKYELVPTHKGYEIRKPNGKFYLYVSKVYDGKYEWVSDYTYAKHFSLKTAKKHLKILELKINQGEFDMKEKELLEQIKNESGPKLLKGDASEMTDIIFDTLFGNTHYPQFDINKTTPIDEQGDCQACDGRRQYIRFGYCGHEYRMDIKLVK